MSELVVYARPDCHLCEEALALLARVRADLPFALEVRDIEADDVTFKAYLERIPVVLVDGVEAYEFFVDEADLRTRLSQPSPG